MTKRVIIAHGWADYPGRGWINWLAGELKSRGIEVSAPAFPDPKKPDTDEWLRILSETIGTPDDETVLVGHSLGCALILRLLSDYSDMVEVGGVVLVAGLGKHPAGHRSSLFEPEFDWPKLKKMIRKRICIYSDDDEWVEPQWTKQLAGWLEAEEIEDKGKGHFSGPRGLNELPSVLEAVLSCFGD